MNNLQKVGGISALINAAAYIVGMGIAFTLLAPYLDAAPEQYIGFMAENQTLLFIWHLLIYLVAGVFMAPMVLGLYERLKAGSPALAQITAVFGIIWTMTVIGSGMLIINNQSVVAALYAQNPAQATAVWLALSAVEEGLGGAIELPGGLWLLLTSWTALQTRMLPKGLNVLGLVVGAAGVLTVFPPLGALGVVFGLGAVVWFIWVGVVMLRGANTVPAAANIVPSHARPIS